MNDTDFELLIASVKEAGQIMRGEIEPARTFQLKPEDLETIQASLRPGMNARAKNDAR